MQLCKQISQELPKKMFCSSLGRRRHGQLRARLRHHRGRGRLSIFLLNDRQGEQLFDEKLYAEPIQDCCCPGCACEVSLEFLEFSDCSRSKLTAQPRKPSGKKTPIPELKTVAGHCAGQVLISLCSCLNQRCWPFSNNALCIVALFQTLAAQCPK